MNYFDLKSFFESQTDAATLESKIQDEVADFKQDLLDRRKPEVSMEEIENEYFILDNTHFEKLCKAYLDGVIGRYELFYIAASIQASENFDFNGKESARLFGQLSNPEVNGMINQKVVTAMLQELK